MKIHIIIISLFLAVGCAVYFIINEWLLLHELKFDGVNGISAREVSLSGERLLLIEVPEMNALYQAVVYSVEVRGDHCVLSRYFKRGLPINVTNIRPSRYCVVDARLINGRSLFASTVAGLRKVAIKEKGPVGP